MPNPTTGTLETIAREVGEALKPLKDILTPDVCERLGLRPPAAFMSGGTIPTKLTEGANLAGELPDLITFLVSSIEAPTPNRDDIIKNGQSLILKIIALVRKIIELGDAIKAQAATLAATDQAQIQQFGEELAKRLVEYCLVTYMHKTSPALTSTLSVLGIVEKEIVKGDPTKPLQVIYEKRRLELARLLKLFSHPDQHFEEIYALGKPTFDGEIMFKKIKQLLDDLKQPVDIFKVGSNPLILEAYIFSLQVDPTLPKPSVKVDIRIPATKDFSETLDITNVLKGTVAFKGRFEAGASGKISAPLSIDLKPPSGNLSLDLTVGFKAEKSNPAENVLLIGNTGGTRLQTHSFGGGLGIAVTATSAQGVKFEPAVRFDIVGGKLVIDLSGSDGFIGQITSGIKIEADFDILGNWTPSKGLKLQGSGGVEVFLPIHINLGIVEIGGLYIVIGFGTDAPLHFEIAVQIKTNLGPLKAVIDRIGTKIPLTFPQKSDGNLGAANLGFAFSPPKGIGLSLDGAVFKGGGFLYFNPEKGEYGGVLELEFKSMFTLKAIGILNTKMPDGTEGFSLIIIITAEFTPIQLGFGFTLLGVGGLLGLNRTMNVQKLAAGVKDGSLNYILFPTDPVANAPTIIAAIGQIFPPKNGQFIFGPMAKIGWGTPTLISLELGLLIEVASPVKIAILGVIRCILPEEHLPIIKLQVNFIGVLDLEKQELFFYASIFDSNLLAFTLAGDMLLLVNWSDDKANFILSVGGFHPAFTPPPLPVPPLSRLSISLLDGDNPRLRLETFFAVTSNTVQLGAKLELYASVGPASIEGMLGFDLLFQFSPFRFIAHIFAGLKAKIFDITLFAVSLDFTLEGPSPWRAHGTATVSVSFFFFSVSVDISFDITWGDRHDEVFPSIKVLSILEKAFADRRNWEAALPPNAHQQISLRELPITEGTPPANVPLIVHPFGILSVSQKAVPLKQAIQVVGNQPVEDVLKTFKIDNVSANGTALIFSDVLEEFAPAQYLKMTDDQKLTRKSFEQMPSGVRIAGTDAFSVGAAAVRTVRYDFKYLTKKKLERVKSKLRYLRSELFGALLRGNAVAQSPLSHAARQKTALAPKDIVLKPEQFAVASSDTLTAMSAAHVFNTESAAYAALEQMHLEKPALKGSIQVVAAYQM
jgi:hypothetical protein